MKPNQPTGHPNGGPCSRFRRSTLGGLLVVLAAGQALSAAVTVETVDGRMLSGVVDLQTDSQRLWIRHESEQIVLTTSVPWSSITSASSDGEQLPLAELPELLGRQASSEPLGFLVEQTVYDAAPVGQDERLPAALSQQPGRRHRQAAWHRQFPAVTPQVRSLSVEACLVNLDRDVEPDGLELTVAALDEHGQAVPVQGSLYVRLWGERIQPDGSLVRYEDLQQWNQPVMPVDFSDGVASYALRFRTVRPEFDLGLHSDALINVRLGVFGQGNFSASAPVPIRKFNPYRDRLQLASGGRFMPNESTQEVRQRLPHRTHTRSLWSRQLRNQ